MFGVGPNDIDDVNGTGPIGVNEFNPFFLKKVVGFAGDLAGGDDLPFFCTKPNAIPNFQLHLTMIPTFRRHTSLGAISR